MGAMHSEDGEMGRCRYDDGQMESWTVGEMVRWGDGQMGRWGDGEMESS